MKIRPLITMAALCVSMIAMSQTKFSVLGDSYSTFAGQVTPKWNAVWYDEASDTRLGNDVVNVDQTWWKMIDALPEYQLDVNNSWSGSTVSLSGYRNEDYSDRAFITRVHNLGHPDVILVFGGTNDAWAGAPIGEYKYADWNECDLYDFRPAFAYLLSSLQQFYPNAVIYNLLNSELKDEINESVDEICKHYGVKNIVLHDIEKQSNHPSQNGMKAITEQVLEVINQ